MSASGKLTREGAALRKAALSYPEATEDMPWGHHAIKVKGKSFVFLAADDKEFSMSAKLPSSAGVALKLPFASPTGYGLGRSGWVTARFPRGAKVPVDILKMWIEESYGAIRGAKARRREGAKTKGAKGAKGTQGAKARRRDGATKKGAKR
jgi:predicted DNA-binding protein (MmcQ/YjbR family)